MNCQDVRELWEDHRDQALPADPAAAVEAHLRSCPACRALWDAESRWLQALPDDHAAPLPSEAALVDNVLARWERERRGPVAGQVGPPVWARCAVAAALIAAVGLALAWPHLPWTSRPRPPAGLDPAGALVREFQDRYFPQPLALVGGMQEATRLLDLDRLAAAAPRLLPDPAELIRPRAAPAPPDAQTQSSDPPARG